MASKENIINLEDFRVEGAKVFTGRDKGASVRQLSKIDELEQKYEKIDFIIPKSIYSINPSFLEELLVNVVRKLGKEGFKKKFNIINQGDYPYERPLDEAIDRILRKRTALG